MTSADAFIDEALRFFGDAEPEAGSPWSKGERLAGLVGQEKALLFLDGMEPLQDEHQGIKDPALARLVECLAEKNAGLCMITTREPVREFLDFPETTEEVDLEQLSKEAGRALLRIKGLRATDDLLEQASEAFGNHALALNLLASYLKRFAGGDVSQALKIPDLPYAAVDDGKHPRRVMVAFAEKFGEGPELELLHLMGLFDRPADAGCIAALKRPPGIAGLTERLSELDEIGWRDLLERLRGFGLLAEASNQALYELDAHPLVREHFGAWLRDKKREAWEVGHGRLFEYLETVPKEHQPESLLKLEPLFRAVSHGCAAGRHFEALFRVYLTRIRRDDQNFHHKKTGAFAADLAAITPFFEETWSKCISSIPLPSQRVVFNQAGLCLRALGNLRDAKVAMDGAHKLAIQSKDQAQIARSANNLSELLLMRGNIKEAILLARNGLKQATETTDRFVHIVVLTTLGYAQFQQGLIDDAEKNFISAEKMQEDYRNDAPKLYSIRSYHYCDLLLERGCIADVLRRGKYTSESPRSQGTHLDVGLGKLAFGRALIGSEAPEMSLAHLNEAVEDIRLSRFLNYLLDALLARSAAFRMIPIKSEDPFRDLDEVMRIAIRCGMRLHECDAHLEYTRLALAEDNPDAALPHFQSADALVTKCGYHRRDPELLELKEKLGL